jgi:hypothetical protein
LLVEPRIGTLIPIARRLTVLAAEGDVTLASSASSILYELAACMASPFGHCGGPVLVSALFLGQAPASGSATITTLVSRNWSLVSWPVSVRS